MNPNNRIVWKTILDNIKNKVTKEQFNTWFSNIYVSDFTEKRINIITPNLFVKECLSSNYTDLIITSINEVNKSKPEIIFQCNDINNNELKNKNRLKSNKKNNYKSPVSNVNKNYTFENFVAGPCNKLAYAASQLVIESPGYMYNPLYIHGHTGTGKTHLLQSIYLTFSSNNYSNNALYITCEDLINNIVTTLKNGYSEQFRKKLREVDILLIDDIHFLSKSDISKEEFFHTFNALYNSQKQIVLSSDRKPEEIPDIEERLISRFNWGLTCTLNPPDFETSLAIIEKKSLDLGINLPLDVIQLIAKNITSNVREIESSILKIKENSLINKCHIHLELAKNTLYEYLNKSKNISFEDILKVIAKEFDLNTTRLLSKNRSKSITLPRQIAMYLTRKLTKLSYNEIGCYFGGRDHTTVMYAYEKVKKLKMENKETQSLLQKIENILQRC